MKAADPSKLPEDVRHKLLLARTAFAAGDAAEAHHWLYAIACPSFACYEPWAAVEGRQCHCGPHPVESLTLPTIEQLSAALENVRAPSIGPLLQVPTPVKP